MITLSCLEWLPWVCILGGIIFIYFILKYYIKSYYENKCLLLEKNLQHERDMKADEWERKKEWETLLSISRIVNAPLDKLIKEVDEKSFKIKELEPLAKKGEILKEERAAQEKVMLIYQLLANKEEVTLAKMKEKQEQISEIYDSIKNILK